MTAPLIEPILTVPPQQEASAARLVKYCRDLDGTELRVVPLDKAHHDRFWKENPKAAFADLQAHGLRTAAKLFKDRPFIWLEADSVPRRKGWVKSLSAEYHKAGKEFLISSDENPPHDLVGGIGVYGPNTHWLIPPFYRDGTSWDLFLIRQLLPLVHRSPLVQHSYGLYGADGQAAPHRFPRDNHILRKDAVIFHRDKFLDLIPRPKGVKKSVFYHTGDLGDIIAALPIIRQLGGGTLLIGNHERKDWRRMEGARFEALRPLLEVQPYIEDVRFDHGADCCSHDLSTFRHAHRINRSLTASQAEHLAVGEVDMAPWLVANPGKDAAGKIVINRTDRYQNPLFPWGALMSRHRQRCLFIGTAEEHKKFQHRFGPVEYKPTGNLMEAAQLIAGSALFVGNQSAACWIAMGLGHPLIQETSPAVQDSIIERPNAQFYRTGLLRRVPGLPFQL